MQRSKLEAVAHQRTAQARGSEVAIIGYIPNSEDERMNDIDIKEAVEYYRTPRGQSPNSPNLLRFDSLDKVIAFDAFHLADHLLTQPLMIIVGDRVGAFGSYRDGYELFNRAASVEKQIHVVEGASHYDLYDRPEATGEALDQLIPFFRKHLL